MSRRGLTKMLKALREKREMSQRELAAKAGTTQAYIAELESGARKNPSLDLLKALAKALKVKLTDLLE